jgi:hypothetical protein
MEQQEPPEFLLDVFADPRSVHDVVKGELRSLFNVTLPYITHPAIP